jgi:Fe-S-cluster containining protein
MIATAFDAGRALATGKPLKQLYSILNHIERNRPKHIACKAGCAWCCFIPVECTRAEYDLAASLAAPAAVKAGDFQPCPFLDRKARTCSVYPYRPLSCRQYNSTSRLKCERAHRKRLAGADIPADGEVFWFYRGVANAIPGERRLLTEWAHASAVDQIDRRGDG